MIELIELVTWEGHVIRLAQSIPNEKVFLVFEGQRTPLASGEHSDRLKTLFKGDLIQARDVFLATVSQSLTLLAG